MTATDAANKPAVRKYSRKAGAVHTDDLPIGQKADIDIGDLVAAIRGESIVNNVGDKPLSAGYLEDLAFNEEPVTIIIEENSRSDFPETHAPCAINGKGAEVLVNGKWVEMTWLPINQQITTKRKYVEVLAYSKSDNIKTQHDEANVERPRNTIQRRTSANYPLSILEDNNPKGREWLARIRMGH